MVSSEGLEALVPFTNGCKVAEGASEGRLGGSLVAEGREGSEEGRPMKKAEISRDCNAAAKILRKWTGEPGHLMHFV